jgi:hypothetical protein
MIKWIKSLFAYENLRDSGHAYAMSLYENLGKDAIPKIEVLADRAFDFGDFERGMLDALKEINRECVGEEERSMSTATELMRLVVHEITAYGQVTYKTLEQIENFLAAEPEAEPVAWQSLKDEELREIEKEFHAERVRTSDEEYLVIYPADYWDWQRAIEKALKEKNHPPRPEPEYLGTDHNA